MKPLQTHWTVTRKICRKILIFDFQLVENSLRSIECSFRSVEQKLSSDQDIQKLQDYFLTISIDRAKVSTDRKCLTSNFYLENSKTWIFTSTTLWNNIFQTQITLLLQPIIVYTYIYNIDYYCNFHYFFL